MERSTFNKGLKFIINILRTLIFHIKVRRRTFYSIFDYKKLSGSLVIFNNPFSTYDFNFYGIGYSLNNKINIKGSKVEHGLVIGSYVQPHLINTSSDSIITFSDYRERYIILKKENIKVQKVGPYIAYASNLYSSKYFKKLKKKLGKVLLVFPEHTLMEIEVTYKRDEFLELVNRKKKDFDTVLICGYWADILKGNLDFYESKDFKIVTAGHNLDYNFLSRLKFIISLSDTVITNSVGTHIGYSMFYNKHLILVKQKSERYLIDKGSTELSARSISDSDSYMFDKEKFYEVFQDSYFSDYNNSLQKEFISQLFGFKYVK